jgi:hypothetical protein
LHHKVSRPVAASQCKCGLKASLRPQTTGSIIVSPLSETAQKFKDEIEKKLEQRKPFASRGFSVGTVDALVADPAYK